MILEKARSSEHTSSQALASRGVCYPQQGASHDPLSVLLEHYSILIRQVYLVPVCSIWATQISPNTPLFPLTGRQISGSTRPGSNNTAQEFCHSVVFPNLQPTGGQNIQNILTGQKISVSQFFFPLFTF